MTDNTSDIINILKGIKTEVWALLISIIAILLASLKDFILPFFIKPKLKIEFKNEIPYERYAKIGALPSKFFRISIKNIGCKSALNCRCQITKLLKDKSIYIDLGGFPLAWSCKPEGIERLNIGIGETEYIDLLYTLVNNDSLFFNKYFSKEIGIPNCIPKDNYIVYLLISGDNFNPILVKFKIDKIDDKLNHNVKIKLISKRKLILQK